MSWEGEEKDKAAEKRGDCAGSKSVSPVAIVSLTDKMQIM